MLGAAKFHASVTDTEAIATHGPVEFLRKGSETSKASEQRTNYLAQLKGGEHILLLMGTLFRS